MKWTKENKEKLHQLFLEKMEQVAFVDPHPTRSTGYSWSNWSGFFGPLGIVSVARRDASSSYSDNWMQESLIEDEYDTPAASRKHIIILDPWWNNRESGLKIPKELAEKFLVLGVP